MGLESGIEHHKEFRKPHRRSKAFDYSCRNHGGCPWCERNRLFNRRRLEAEVEDRLKEEYDKR